VESRMLLELSPALARYSTFGGLNTPLHFAAAKGHLDVSVISSHAFLSFQRFRLILLRIVGVRADCHAAAGERC
jgi:hypothetical protein